MVGARVMIIDDDADVREAICDCLADAGFEVETAPDGASALERLRCWVPDVIVLDLVMPGMSGQEFVERCRSQPVLERVPILVSTGDSGAHLDAAAARVTKPFNVEQLLEGIRLCLRADSGEEDEADAATW